MMCPTSPPPPSSNTHRTHIGSQNTLITTYVLIRLFSYEHKSFIFYCSVVLHFLFKILRSIHRLSVSSDHLVFLYCACSEASYLQSNKTNKNIVCANSQLIGVYFVYFTTKEWHICVYYSEAPLQPYTRSIRRSHGLPSPKNGRTFTS